MTKNEAIQAMREGKKVRHYYFSKDEWMTLTSGGMYLLEDGVVCSPSEFWRWRTEKSWDTDWEIYTE
jgi:hypothetical protein